MHSQEVNDQEKSSEATVPNMNSIQNVLVYIRVIDRGRNDAAEWYRRNRKLESSSSNVQRYFECMWWSIRKLATRCIYKKNTHMTSPQTSKNSKNFLQFGLHLKNRAFLPKIHLFSFVILLIWWSDANKTRGHS